MRKVYFITGWVALLVIFSSGAMAQTYFYFQDSPSNEYYDYSWMELTSPSMLEREGSDNRKFPVESTVPAQQGMNSLRLKWTSNAGGNWYAIAAGMNWTGKDISDTDTLLFYLRSKEGISSADLPYVFMEDETNKKSDFHLISGWTGDLSPGAWTKIKIPMTQFFDANDGTDWTRIKTIGFAQNAADGVEHTLFVDDMRVIKGTTTAPEAEAPQMVEAKGYDSHLEISWAFNTEENLQGYRIEKSTNGGEDFSILAYTDPDTRYYIDFVGPSSEPVSGSYRVLAINAANEPSGPSDTVEAQTHEFTDDEFLDMVQEYTFRYFWDFGHPVSGMARERNTSGHTVTSGGSGFGLMAILVGIERGFITREEGAERMLTILNFLESADRFHGAWSHWMHGETGLAKPFSTYDNGGDIVETAFMAQGLLTVRQYFTGESETEQVIVAKATELWEGIEWDWYRRDGSSSIYWHWSPDYDWQMNMRVTGWNEAAIVYLLAIASPTHGVPAGMWESGWVSSNYYNYRTPYGIKLFVGSNLGGPMFFAHYSFLGFDPNNIRDDYANYFDHNQHQALVQQAYCEGNPRLYKGYSADCWGITASDDPDGYLAHEPNTGADNGTIAPTAALGSFPYTPEASMRALKHFYRNLGEKTWGWMGFKDAFNESRNWWADSYLAIDQGPIIIMMENYRSQLLWNLFMSNPEIDPMLEAIGFRESPNAVPVKTKNEPFTLTRTVSNNGPVLEVNLEEPGNIDLRFFDLSGKEIPASRANSRYTPGKHRIELVNRNLDKGMYVVVVSLDGKHVYADKYIIY